MIPANAGYTHVVRPSLTVQATPDYSDGDCVGGLFTLEAFARTSPEGDGIGGSGILTRFALRSLIDITVGTVVHIFDANPSASTFTDNSAISINSADRSKLLKSITVAADDWLDPQGGSGLYVAELIKPGDPDWPMISYELSGGRDLYFAIEAEGTINFSSTSDLSAIIAAEQN